MSSQWKDAPEWAKYKALAPNGWVYWFEEKPTSHFSGWQTTGRVLLAGRPLWKDTIEERPID